MKLYNTLTRKIDEFIPNNKNEVKMYTCGPTVYHFAHIGNLRSYLMEDVLEKSLNYRGYKVDRVMNITDVGHLSSDADTGEDKMVKGAIREHKSVLEIAKFYTDKFFLDCSKLNIKKPDTVIPATTCIDSYIKMITSLLEKGYAYASGGNIYFDTSKLKEYYVLTNHNVDDLKEAVRNDVEVDNNKKNKNDFVLWFTKSKFEEQQLKWDSPWGIGYPGWHIECSCISLKYLGEYLDIHCGGVDNIFPHHTNEIAQTESYVEHKWCNYWFHVEHLNDINGKMSKSNGDFLTLDLLESKNYNPIVYRLFCLQSHYRKTLVFSYDNLDSATITYNKLKNKVVSLTNTGDVSNTSKYQKAFNDAIDNDLNTASMLTVLYDVLKADDLNDASKLYLVNDFDKVLSLDLTKEDIKEIDSELETYILNKIEERKVAKNNKDYALADQIREELDSKGIVIKDTREGTTYTLK
ncbi:MAG TPA: cysteine--tRNA ligase [Bacilli bacterium]|nr:cysteine--tRNA ligase [Bacilli bacterium]